MEESMSSFDWSELLPTLIVYSLTFLLGLTGNTLIIFTITVYRRMKSTTNLFLASLASADLLLILCCIPVKVAKLFSFTWTMGQFLCKMVHYMQGVSAFCSVLTLTAMSLERYYAIVHPMKAKSVCTMSQTRKIIACIWCLSILLALPILRVQIQLAVGEKYKAFWCVRDWESKEIWRTHETYMFILILVFPAIVMVMAYTAICWEICRVIQRRSYMTAGKVRTVSESSCQSSANGSQSNLRLEEDHHTVKQVIKMLVAVVVVFVVCWGPLLVENLLTAWGLLPEWKVGVHKYLSTTFHLMAYFNSCVNPIVYGFMSRNFRDSFREALRCCGRTPLRKASCNQTTTTSFRNAGFNS